MNTTTHTTPPQPTNLTPLFNQYVSLNDANTMALACTADHVVTLTDEDQALDFLNQYNAHCDTISTLPLPLFILSGGSNVLLPPVLHACVVRPLFKGIKCVKEDENHVYIEAKAGENWHEFVMHSISQGWYGLENLALIPGLVGASPVQNIGAYGIELCDVFDSLTAINLSTCETHLFDKNACDFAYRDSVFKHNPNTWLITKVVFKLHRKPKLNLGYGDVAELARQLSDSQEPTPASVAQAIIRIRQSKLPNPSDIANTGSFFKNPIVMPQKVHQIQEHYPDAPHYPQPNGKIKLAAGWLIDKAGLKGYRQQDIATHEKQALVVVNHAPNISQQADIIAFSAYIQNKVKQQFGVTLDREPVLVNNDGSTS